MATFPTITTTVIAASIAVCAAPALAQGPACTLDGWSANQMKTLARTKPDLSAISGVALGRQTLDEVIATIEDTRSTQAMIDTARAKIPAARDTCVAAISSKPAAMGNLAAHACVALSDYAQRRDEAVKCRVDWIEFIASQVKAPDRERIKPLLGDVWETKGKVQIAQQDLNGAQASYQRAVGYQETVPRLLNLADLYRKRSDTAQAITTYRALDARPDIGEKRYDVLRNWAVLVSEANAPVADRRARWEALKLHRSTPEANLRYAETFLAENPTGAPDPKVTEALLAATSGTVADGDTVQANARSFAWYYRAVFAARTASDREAWKVVGQQAGDGSAAPRATRLKCLAEIAGGGLRYPSDVGACPSAASTPEQLFLRGAMILRASQFLPPRCTTQLRNQGKPCTEDYSAKWLGLVSQAKEQFALGRNLANATDALDWLQQGDEASPNLVELLKAGETVAQDWQTIRPGFASCTTYPAPANLDPKARDVFSRLDLLNCAHR